MAPLKRPPLQSLIAVCNRNADTFAITSGDGRVKVWDVSRGHTRGEFAGLIGAPDAAGNQESIGHLDAKITCLTWSPDGSSSLLKKESKKGAKGKVAVQLLAIGTAGGDVLLWDAAAGKLQWRAVDCHEGGVASLSFAPSGSKLYSVGADGYVGELEVSSGTVLRRLRGSKKPLSSVQVSPDGGSILVGGLELKLLDLASSKKLRKYRGHPTSVRAMAFSEDGKFALSAAECERQVMLWPVEDDAAGTKAASLAMENPAVWLGCGREPSSNLALQVLAVSESGEAYFWQGATVEELNLAVPSRISAKNGVVLAAQLAGSALLIVHGTSACPVFQSLPIPVPGKSLVLEGESEGTLLRVNNDPSTATEGPAQLPEVVLGPEQTAGTRAHVTSSASKKRRSLEEAGAQVGHVDTNGTLADAEVKGRADQQMAPGDPMDSEGPAELTLEERLAALETNWAPPQEDLVEVDIPRADSVGILIQQALQAGDRVLLDRCFLVTDSKMVENSVRRLQPSDAVKLLAAAVERLQARPSKGSQLVLWIRTVLLQHAAFLMTAPSAHSTLSTLHEIIGNRVAVLQPMLALSGRLDLVVSQMKMRGAESNDELEPGKGQDGIVVFEERDSDEDVDDVVTGVSSDRSVSSDDNDGDDTDGIESDSEDDDAADNSDDEGED